MFNKPQVICFIEKSVPYTIFDSLWIPCSAKFVVLGGMGTGSMQIYELSGNEVELLQEDTKQNQIKCGTFGASSLRSRELATGDLGGNLEIWNIEDIRKSTYSVFAHENGVMCIDGTGGQAAGFGPPEIVTGGSDGYVKVWDPRQKEKPVIAMEPFSNYTKRACWSVAFGNSYNSEERVVCAAYDNGDIKLFDLKTGTVRWETHFQNAACRVEFNKKEAKLDRLLATCLESTFHVFQIKDDNTFDTLTEKMKQRGSVWLGTHLPQNPNIFATFYGDGSMSIWKYPTQYKLNASLEHLQTVTSISTMPVSSFNWCPDKIGLGLHTSLDQKIRLLIVTKLHLQ